jgi:hypothetical protein
VRRLRQVGYDGLAADVAAEAYRDVRPGLLPRGRIHDLAQEDVGGDLVRNLHADGVLAGDRRQDADGLRLEVHRYVVFDALDAGDLYAGLERDLEARHSRADDYAAHPAVDAEALQRGLQNPLRLLDMGAILVLRLLGLFEQRNGRQDVVGAVLGLHLLPGLGLRAGGGRGVDAVHGVRDVDRREGCGQLGFRIVVGGGLVVRRARSGFLVVFAFRREGLRASQRLGSSHGGGGLDLAGAMQRRRRNVVVVRIAFVERLLLVLVAGPDYFHLFDGFSLRGLGFLVHLVGYLAAFAVLVFVDYSPGGGGRRPGVLLLSAHAVHLPLGGLQGFGGHFGGHLGGGFEHVGQDGTPVGDDYEDDAWKQEAAGEYDRSYSAYGAADYPGGQEFRLRRRQLGADHSAGQGELRGVLPAYA